MPAVSKHLTNRISRPTADPAAICPSPCHPHPHPALRPLPSRTSRDTRSEVTVRQLSRPLAPPSLPSRGLRGCGVGRCHPCRFCRPPCHPLPHCCHILAAIVPLLAAFATLARAASPANPLEIRDQKGEHPRQHQKTAKTAMCTNPVNIAGTAIPVHGGGLRGGTASRRGFNRRPLPAEPLPARRPSAPVSPLAPQGEGPGVRNPNPLRVRPQSHPPSAHRPMPPAPAPAILDPLAARPPAPWSDHRAIRGDRVASWRMADCAAHCTEWRSA